MTGALIAAFILGIASGMRTFVPPAVLLLVRGPLIVGIVFGVGALLEFVGDALPRAPSRTRPIGLAARIISGAFVGWLLAPQLGGPEIGGAICGVAGALVGAYGGLLARLRAIALIGPIPAALVGDAIAVALAVFIVTRAAV